MHQIENKFLKVRTREQGAELTSVFDKMNNIEHLWQADPQVWGWHAPVLFPVVGRCLNDEINVGDAHYRLDKHGFARKSNFRLLDLTETRIVFSLKSNEQWLKIYPYKFEFLIAYRVDENKLYVSYEVINKDDKPIYFSIGGHPAFAVPFTSGESHDDYYLEFEQTENVSRQYINADGYFDGRQDVVLANSNIIPLRNGLFSDDALIFKDLQSRKVTLKGKRNNHFVRVDFNDFEYLGLWSKVGADYVCIEPWLGCADTAGKPVEFKDKEGIIRLEPSTSKVMSYIIEIG